MWNVFKKLQSKSGYTLVEMAVVVSIASMLAVGGLSILDKYNNTKKIEETNYKLEKIKKALNSFARSKGYLPCPALPALPESNQNFGKSISMITGGSVTSTTTYNSSSHTCSNNGLSNGTGMVPVRTINLPDDYAYDGWDRKFTFRTADNSGAAADFGDPMFKGDIAILDLNGNHKTRIDTPPPRNYGAIYVIISYGKNGRSVAYRKNYDYSAPGADPAPGYASGIEKQNTVHTNKYYIQNPTVNGFDDIVAYATKFDITASRLDESPVTINSDVCANAELLYKDVSNSNIDTVFGTYDNSYLTHATAVSDAARRLAFICENAPPAITTAQPSDIPGIRLWLDADDANTIFTGSNCSTGQAPSNGSYVACWKDKGPGGINVTQTGGNTVSPTYTVNGRNGHNVLDFDGNDILTKSSVLGSSLASADEVTLFLLQQQDTATNGAPFMWDNGSRFGVHAIWGSDNNLYFDFGGACCGSRTNAVTSGFTGSYRIITFMKRPDASNNTTEVWINGSSFMTGQHTVNFPDSGTATFKIYDTFDGKVGEIITYNRALSTKEREDIEAYLSGKWAVDVASTASQMCSNGMIFKKTATDPIGGCHCPDGQDQKLELTTTNACFPSTSTVGQCVAVNSKPTYSSPPTSAGMVLWLDANDCSTLSLNNSSKVVTWYDKSPAGNNATQSNDNYKPTYNVNRMNSLPTVYFNGSNYLQTSLVPATGTNPRTIIAVIENMVANEAYDHIIHYGNSSNNQSYGLAFRTGTPYFLTDHYWASNITSNVPITTSPMIAMLSYDGTTDSLYYNGKLAASLVKALSTGSTYPLRIGARILDGPMEMGQFDMGEAIVYNKVLSDKERSDINSYLSSKWGIPIVPESPGGVSGLKLWLDASDSNFIKSSYDCTGGVPSNGATVGCWMDKSSNSGSNYTQLPSSSRPLYITGAANNKPIVRFSSASGQFLSSSYHPYSATDGRTSFFVMRSTVGSISAGNIFLYTLSTSGTSTNRYALTSEIGLSADGGGSIVYPSPTTESSGTYSIVTISNAASSQVNNTIARLNGLQLYGITISSNAINSEITANSVIGANGSGTAKFDGDIAEILMYNSALATSDKKIIEQLLSSKWGIPLVLGGVTDNIKLWLDANDSSTLFDTSGCTGSTPANGASVICIKDKSNSTNGTVLNATGNNVLRNTTGINNKGTLDFDAANAVEMDTSATSFAGLNGQNSYSAVIVMNPTNSSGYPLAIKNSSYQQFYITPSCTFWHSGAEDTSTATADYILPTNFIAGNAELCSFIRTSGTGQQAWRNRSTGTTISSLTTSAMNTNATGMLGSGFTGKIGEVALFSSALSNADRSTIENYLSNKWGVYLSTQEIPKTIRGLKVWFDAQDNGTLIANTNCTGAQVIANNGTVGCWKDKSGNGLDAVAATAPTYLTSGVNSKPALDFNGSTQRVTVPLNINPASIPVIVGFIVFDSDVASGANRKLLGNDDGGYDRAIGIDTRAATGLTYFTGAGVGNISNISANTPYLLVFKYESNSFSAWLNGTQTNNFTAASNGSGTTSFSIGSLQTTSNSEMFDGQIGEVLLYDKTDTLQPNDITTISAYLSNKWGITVAGTPQSIAGLKLWLDASDTTTMYTDNGCSVGQYPSNNTAIACWKDKSGNNLKALQSSSTARPTFRTDAMPDNGYSPAMVFDGSNDNFTVSNNPNIVSDDFTIIALLMGESSSYSDYRWFGGAGIIDGEVGGVTNDFGMSFSSTGQAIIGTGNPDKSASGYVTTSLVSYPVINNLMFTRTKSTGKMNLYSSNINLASNTGGTQSLTAPPTLSIGSLQTGSNYLNGKIGEILIYNSALSAANRYTIASYLDNKWGWGTQTLSSSAPAPTLWLDASDPYSLFTSNDCSTGVAPANGATIGCWTNKMNIANSNYIQATAGSRPTYVANVIGSKPVLRFASASSQFLYATYAPYSGTQTRTSIFVTGSANGANAATKYDLFTLTNNNPGSGLRYLITSETGVRISGANALFTANSVESSTTPASDHYIFILSNPTVNMNQTTVRVNGVNATLQSSVTSYTMNSSTGTSQIGGNTGSAAGVFDGDISEIIMFNSALSVADQQILESYLGSKWGITVW